MIYKIKIFTIFIICGLGFLLSFYVRHEPEKVAAFVRVKNEINTIEACLKSIERVFDRIVIIYVDEPDDGTVAFVKKWCDAREKCFHYAYPYSVLPSHHEKYQTGFDDKNSLAAYTNFGVEKFEPEEWIVKLDADQIYLTDELKKFVSTIKRNHHHQKNVTEGYALTGYNTFEWKGYFVQYKKGLFNGAGGDALAVKRKNMQDFIQMSLYEHLRLTGIDVIHYWPKPVWFHYMKSLKSQGNVRLREEATDDEIHFLSQKDIQVYKTKAEPFLPSYSAYQKLRLSPGSEAVCMPSRKTKR